MSTNTQKRNKKEESKKTVVRVLCIVLSALMVLPVLYSLITAL